MFKDRSFNVKVVKDPKVEEVSPMDAAALQTARNQQKVELVKEATAAALGCVVVYKAVDTMSQVILHIVKAKIK